MMGACHPRDRGAVTTVMLEAVSRDSLLILAMVPSLSPTVEFYSSADHVMRSFISLMLAICPMSACHVNDSTTTGDAEGRYVGSMKYPVPGLANPAGASVGQPVQGDAPDADSPGAGDLFQDLVFVRRVGQGRGPPLTQQHGGKVLTVGGA